MNKISKIVYTAFLVLTIVIAVFFILYTPEKFGGDTKYQPVLTGNMEPSIPLGGLVLIKPTNPEMVQIGDIICFNFSESTLIIQRVVNITSEGIATKAAANEDKDLKIVDSQDIIGEVVLVIPFLGHIVTFAQTTTGFFLFLIIPIILVTVYEIKNVFSELKLPNRKK
jgi:signal peptidase